MAGSLLFGSALALVGCNGQVDDAAETDDRTGSGGSSAGSGTSGGGADIPDDCEDVLVPRKTPPDCGSAACGIIEETPERVVQWQIYIERSGDAYDAAALHTIDCVERQLVALGAKLIDSNGGDVVVDARHEDIASVMHTTAIDHIEATCPDQECCTEHSEQAACNADPLCNAVLGTRLDTGSACGVFVECRRHDSFCVSYNPALDEDGACWRFSSGCVPEGFTELPYGGAEGCTDAAFEALAPCSD